MDAGAELKRATRALPGCVWHVRVGHICFGSCVAQFYGVVVVASPQHLGLDGASESSQVNVNKNLHSQRGGTAHGVSPSLSPSCCSLCPVS